MKGMTWKRWIAATWLVMPVLLGACAGPQAGIPTALTTAQVSGIVTPAVTATEITATPSPGATTPPAATASETQETATRAAGTETNAGATETRQDPGASPTARAEPSGSASATVGVSASATRAAVTETRPPTTALDPATTLAVWQKRLNDLAARADAQAEADRVWEELVGNRRVPLVLDDAVLFMYKGAATSVAWRGDFSGWEFGPAVVGKRVGRTDLWYGVTTLPRDSRTEYKVYVNGKEQLDAANPEVKTGGLGDNSVLKMPDYRVTDETTRRPGVPTGKVTESILFPSKAMGYGINYRVYTPRGYETLKDLPVLYVTDGNDFGDERIGGMPAALDNLIAAGRIRPAIAVFLDARDPNPPNANRREIEFLVRPEDYAKFLTAELIPKIDGEYRTDARREGRAIVGTSYGGVFATYAALRYPEVFGKLAAFSPAYWVLSNPGGVAADRAAGGRRMNTLIQSQLQCGKAGKPACGGALKVFMSTGIVKWDVGDLTFMARPLRARGDAVEVMQVQEGHNWGAWAGETDEMLEYLFPTST